MAFPDLNQEGLLNLLKQVFQASQAGIAIADARQTDLPLIYVNAAFERITGYSEEEVIGKNCRFLQGVDTDQPALTELRAALRAQRACQAMLRNYRKNGEPFYNLFSLSPIFDDSGNLTYYLGIQQEVTELKRSEDALRQLNAEKVRALQTTAHELRNPLQAISLIVNILEKKYGKITEDAFLHRLRSIKATVDHINVLISRILEGNETTIIALIFEKVDFALKLETVLAEYIVIAAQKNIAIEQSLSSQELFVLADRVAVIQVLDNLISNAVKYSPPNSTVRVRAYHVGDVVRFEVSDEGQGFSDSDKQKLFQPFTKLSAKPTGGEKSVGLGLSIVKRLMDDMNGSIRCQSTFGKGATMIIELPTWND